MSTRSIAPSPASLLRISSLAALALCLLLSACGRKKPVENDPAATAAALAALQDRVKKVASYELEGVVTDVASGQAVRFTYALRQPQLLFVHLVEPNQSLVFDGKVLTGIDGQSKVVMRRSLDGLDDATRIAALYEMFGHYVAEGWRPPLLRTDPTVLEGRIVTADDPRSPPSWILTSRLNDDTIAAVRYELHAPRADFVKKEFLDKAGLVVAFTKVLEEHRDEATGLKFPKKWERKDASGHVKVELTRIAVNGDVPLERFQPGVPEGYTVREEGGPLAPPPAPAQAPAPVPAATEPAPAPAAPPSEGTP